MSVPGTATPFATIEQAIEDIRRGRMVVVCDDEDRENEGDLTLAAQFATPEAINFMAKEGRGLICLSLTPERCDELGLDLMAAKNESPFETPFTVSIEAREGVTTGISAARPGAHDPGRDRPGEPPLRPRPAGARVPAQEPPGRRARARRPDRGGGRPGAPGGAEPGGRDLRDHERRRHDGAGPRPRRVLRPPRPQHDHGRRPDRLPAPPRQARRTRRRDAAADDLRRVPGDRLPLAGGRQAPRRARQGRGRGRARRARAGPLRVPHRRRLPLAALRLRRAARIGALDDRARGQGRAAVPLPGGTRDRPAEQAARLPPAGGRPRHGRGERAPRACRPTCATTGSAPRSSSTSASARSGSSPTTRRRSAGSRATGCRSAASSRSSTPPTSTTRSTCAPRPSAWATRSTTRA